MSGKGKKFTLTLELKILLVKRNTYIVDFHVRMCDIKSDRVKSLDYRKFRKLDVQEEVRERKGILDRLPLKHEHGKLIILNGIRSTMTEPLNIT